MPIPRRITLPIGFLIAVAPVLASASGFLRVRILDAGHKTAVPARVNVIGSDSAYYERIPRAILSPNTV